MKFSDLTIGARFGAGIGMLLISMAAVGGIGLWGLKAYGEQASAMADAQRGDRLASELKAILQGHAIVMDYFLNAGDIGQVRRLEAAANAQADRAGEILDELRFLAPAHAQEGLDAIARAAEAFRAKRNQAVWMRPGADPQGAAGANAFFGREAVPRMQAYFNAVAMLQWMADREAKAARSRAGAAYDRANALLIACVGLALALGVLSGRMIALGIARAVQINSAVGGGEMLTQRAG